MMMVLRVLTVKQIPFVWLLWPVEVRRHFLERQPKRRDFFYTWGSGELNSPGLPLVGWSSFQGHRASFLLLVLACYILPRAGKLPGPRLVSNRGHWPRYVGYTGRPWASWPICEVHSLQMGPYGRLISHQVTRLLLRSTESSTNVAVFGQNNLLFASRVSSRLTSNSVVYRASVEISRDACHE